MCNRAHTPHTPWKTHQKQTSSSHPCKILSCFAWGFSFPDILRKFDPALLLFFFLIYFIGKREGHVVVTKQHEWGSTPRTAYWINNLIVQIRTEILAFFCLQKPGWNASLVSECVPRWDQYHLCLNLDLNKQRGECWQASSLRRLVGPENGRCPFLQVSRP